MPKPKSSTTYDCVIKIVDRDKVPISQAVCFIQPPVDGFYNFYPGSGIPPHGGTVVTLVSAIFAGPVSVLRYERESFIAAQIENRIIAPMIFKSTCNTDIFNTWLNKVLIPELTPGQIIIMDNASFHKSARTREFIESAGCRVLYLLPYSPDLNPIE